MSEPARQKVFMSMGVLGGMLVYGHSHLTGEFGEQTRRGFLMTHGLQFISSRRAHRAFRRAQAHKKMNMQDEEFGEGKKDE